MGPKRKHTVTVKQTIKSRSKKTRGEENNASDLGRAEIADGPNITDQEMETLIRSGDTQIGNTAKIYKTYVQKFSINIGKACGI